MIRSFLKDLNRYTSRRANLFYRLTLLLYPNLLYIFLFRVCSWLYFSKYFKILLVITYPLYKFFGILLGNDISIKAQIGAGLYLGHTGGVVISKHAVIGKRADISHQVTIGVSGKGKNFGCPIIGDNVYLAPGAKLFGKIIIGDNVKIGANAVVYKSVPDNSVVVLDPGFKIIGD